MNPDLLHALADEWRTTAKQLREYGAVGGAKACEKHAEELEQRIREWQMEPLPIKDAAQESGYSEDHLYDLVNDGTIPNAGKKGAPRIRRRDLPRRPGHGTTEEPTLVQQNGDFADEILESRGAQ